MARYRGMNEYSSPGVYWIGTELGVYESAEVVVPQSDWGSNAPSPSYLPTSRRRQWPGWTFASCPIQTVISSARPPTIPEPKYGLQPFTRVPKLNSYSLDIVLSVRSAVPSETSFCFLPRRVAGGQLISGQRTSSKTASISPREVMAPTRLGRARQARMPALTVNLRDEHTRRWLTWLTGTWEPTTPMADAAA